MRTIEQISSDDNISGWCDYTPIIEEFGEIILRKDTCDYQGDTWVLYKDGDRYGYLCFGWGSCSGCDALQACSCNEEVQVLMDELYRSIQWFDSKEEALKFIVDSDWKGTWQWHSSEFKEFLIEATKILS